MAGRVILHIDLNSSLCKCGGSEKLCTGRAAGRCGRAAPAKCGIDSKL